MAIPSHKLYASNGSTLLYTIADVVRREPPLAINVPDYVEHTNKRSAGSIIIHGGNQPYNLSLYARLKSTNYTNLMIALENLKSTITVNTHYYLKFDKTLVHDENLESLKVMRLSIDVDPNIGNLNKFLYYTIVFRVLCW